MTTLSVIVPCYNESGNIPLIIKRFTECLKGCENVEILLVDNGSTDDSADIFEKELSMALPCFKLVTVDVNQGYGFGILRGLEAARGDVLAWTHADMQTDPKDVFIAWDLYQKHGDDQLFVKGKRRNRKLLESFFTWGMQCIASWVLKTKLDDINAQPKLFSKVFYQDHVKYNAPQDFSLDLYALYKAKMYASRVIEVPVDFAKRTHGEAKGGGSWKTRIHLIRRTFKYIFELRKHLENEQ